MSTSKETKRTRGRRPSLSLEIVLGETIEILDADGEGALTFRALASRLETGVGSIYHYVRNKDQLLDGATNIVLQDTLPAGEIPEDPFEALRTLSLSLFDTMQEHPWAGVYLMRDIKMQPNAMKLFEIFGQQLMKVNLTNVQRFNAVSSLITFVVGAGAEMRELPEEKLAESKTQQEYLREYADAWRALDIQEFPFVHSIADSFAEHSDVEQFIAGVDLFLAGIRAQIDAG